MTLTLGGVDGADRNAGQAVLLSWLLVIVGD
jgi:hypothetical protein